MYVPVCVCVCVPVCPPPLPPLTPPTLWGWTVESPPKPPHDPSPPLPHPYPQAIAWPTPGKNYPLKSTWTQETYFQGYLWAAFRKSPKPSFGVLFGWDYHPGRNHYKTIPWNIFFCKNLCNCYKDNSTRAFSLQCCCRWFVPIFERTCERLCFVKCLFCNFLVPVSVPEEQLGVVSLRFGRRIVPAVRLSGSTSSMSNHLDFWFWNISKIKLRQKICQTKGLGPNYWNLGFGTYLKWHYVKKNVISRARTNYFRYYRQFCWLLNSMVWRYSYIASKVCQILFGEFSCKCVMSKMRSSVDGGKQDREEKSVHCHHRKKIFWGTFLASKKNFPGWWWIHKPYENQEKPTSTTELFPLLPPFFSAKKSSALEQGGVCFLFPSRMGGPGICVK